MRLEGGDQSSRLWLLDRHNPSVIDSGADGGSLASPHLSASTRVSASTRRCESCRSAGANSTRCSRKSRQPCLGTWHSGAPNDTLPTAPPMNDLPRCPELSQLPGTTRVLARARSACTVPKDRAKRLVLSRSPAKHPPTGVGRLRPQSTKTCVQHLRACRATRACCATREGRKTRSRQIRTGWLAGVTLGRP